MITRSLKVARKEVSFQVFSASSILSPPAIMNCLEEEGEGEGGEVLGLRKAELRYKQKCQ